MGVIVEGGILRSVKRDLEKDLQSLFDDVFERGPASGQFNFKAEDAWKTYYAELHKHKILRGVWICRAINSGIVWFPVYHFIDEQSDGDMIEVPDGARKYSYVKLL